MSSEILRVEGLSKFFPVKAGILRHTVGQIKAVDGVDFAVAEGAVVGLVGESGSGKSTIARTVMRLIEPTSGTIEFLGRDFQSLSPEQLRLERTQMQMVFQNPASALNPRKTVGESIGEPLRYHGRVSSASEEFSQVRELLAMVGLPPEMVKRYPHQLSGGQQQRVCIGRAIALRPRLLVCDEAVSALDVSIQAQVLNLLLDLRKSLFLSYLFISHDLSIVRYICDTIIVLYLGKVMESGPAEEVFRHPRHPYTQALLSAIPKSHPQEVRSPILLQGEIPSPIDPPSGCPFRTRCLYAQERCKQKPPKQVIAEEKGEHLYHCILPPEWVFPAKGSKPSGLPSIFKSKKLL
jgi:oligopeptide/dipeptide ABC transporter ATP-binding protein